MSTPAKKAAPKSEPKTEVQESDSDPNWIFFEHQETGNRTRAPRQPGVLPWFLSRGWLETAPVDGDTPISVPPLPEDESGQWVTLYHPGVDSVHNFPNNAGALAGARESGWTDLPDSPETSTKNADSIPADQKEEVKTNG